jgi:hypothetical protein
VASIKRSALEVSGRGISVRIKGSIIETSPDAVEKHHS